MRASPSLSARPQLCLGTVQLGMAYGVANRDGMPGEAQARQLISEALEGGITLFDTAQAYGEAEARLGAMAEAIGAHGGQVITKLSPDADASNVGRLVRQSRERLGVG